MQDMAPQLIFGSSMTRFAIYSRYSSDLQNPASIEDQVRICSERVVRDGGVVTEVFADHAISGASALMRPQFQSMLTAIAQRRFDAVITEALDRYSRNLSDTNDLRELCKFHGVKLMTLDHGEIGLIHVGMAGTMSAVFLEQLAEKVKRGQRGAFERGTSPGGLAYGYGVGSTPGSRFIVDSKAAVIRRIFEDYIAGMSPRAIVKDLNREGVLSPTGGPWRASLIVGSRKRGNGILHNELYRGKMVFGRQKRAKNPATGKTIMQPVPAHEWRIKAVPELQIVTEAHWNSVRARIDRMGGSKLQFQRRPPRLLSGLIFCASCGGPMIIKSGDRYCCRVAREEGTCAHARPVRAGEIESRVVTALQGLMADRDIEATFNAEVRAQWAKAQAQGPQKRADAAARLARAEKSIAGLMKAIEDGLYTPDMKQRLAQQTAARDQARRDLAASEPAVQALFPRMADRFREMVDAMGKWLDSNTRYAATAKEVIRGMTEMVHIYADDLDGRRHIEITGNLSGVIGGSERTLPAMSRIRLVA